MITQTTPTLKKFKRGVTKLTEIATGKEWYYYITTPNGNYLCYELPNGKGEDKTFSPAEVSEAGKPRAAINSKAKPLTKEQKAFKADLNVFFANQALVFPDNCENCGAPLDAFTMWDRRCMTAHILEKNERAFPEVATHPQNKLFLGTKNCSCHNSYDKKGAAYRASMPCYPLALTRFKEFAGELSEVQLNKAYKYLNIESEVAV